MSIGSINSLDSSKPSYLPSNIKLSYETGTPIAIYQEPDHRAGEWDVSLGKSLHSYERHIKQIGAENALLQRKNQEQKSLIEFFMKELRAKNLELLAKDQEIAKLKELANRTVSIIEKNDEYPNEVNVLNLSPRRTIRPFPIPLPKKPPQKEPPHMFAQRTYRE